MLYNIVFLVVFNLSLYLFNMVGNINHSLEVHKLSLKQDNIFQLPYFIRLYIYHLWLLLYLQYIIWCMTSQNLGSIHHKNIF